jgi:hypothetical protein
VIIFLKTGSLNDDIVEMYSKWLASSSRFVWSLLTAPVPMVDSVLTKVLIAGA